MLIRSLLFAPGNQPALLKKFPRYDADAFVVDLEDGTPEAEKAAARQQLADTVTYLRDQRLRGLLFVRTNGLSSSHIDADLEAALHADIDGLVIPKVGGAGDVKRFGAALTDAERKGRSRPLVLVGLIESAIGVINLEAMAGADSRLRVLAFGGEDFISDVGGRRTAEGLEVLYARSRVVLVAKAAGLSAIDQVVVDIRDDDQFRRDAIVGRNLGYDGKMCLLPRQVGLANAVFSPTPEEIDRSRRLIQACELAAAEGRGVIDFEGRMIDPPLLSRARAVLELASRVGGGAV
jgi:citrate lyase subunit beta / citryl-CoA lyase